jgi:hypothetical protein
MAVTVPGRKRIDRKLVKSFGFSMNFSSENRVDSKQGGSMGRFPYKTSNPVFDVQVDLRSWPRRWSPYPPDFLLSQEAFDAFPSRFSRLTAVRTAELFSFTPGP